MAWQTSYVTNNRRLRPNQLGDLNARLSFLPTQLQQESQDAFQQAQIGNMAETNKLNVANLELANKRYGLEEQNFGLQSKVARFNQKATTKAADLAERKSEMATGVTGATLGFNVLGSDWMKKDVNGLMGNMGINNREPHNPGEPMRAGTDSFWGNIPVGASIGGGLMGFGASRLLPTKNKFLKAGAGAGVGALTGLMGSGEGQGGWGALGGGLLGGLGGLI